YMKNCTVGFIFNAELDKVLLMHKNRPEWQKGKLNAPGGKIEEGESSEECIVREIEEETGLHTTPKDWNLFAIIENPSIQIDFYYMVYEGKLSDIQQTTDEQPEWISV